MPPDGDPESCGSCLPAPPGCRPCLLSGGPPGRLLVVGFETPHPGPASPGSLWGHRAGSWFSATEPLNREPLRVTEQPPVGGCEGGRLLQEQKQPAELSLRAGAGPRVAGGRALEYKGAMQGSVWDLWPEAGPGQLGWGLDAATGRPHGRSGVLARGKEPLPSSRPQTGRGTLTSAGWAVCTGGAGPAARMGTAE